MNWIAVTPPLTEQAEDVDRVWNVFVIGALIVGGIVAALITTAIVRRRRRTSELPRQVRENIPYEIAYTVVPLLIVIGLFAITYVSVYAIDEVDDDADLVVEVVGFQWQWQFTYPESGAVEIGTDTERPELVLPAGASVRFELTSLDVIHSFWIPGFRYKRDLWPGETQVFQVDVGQRVGAYPDSGICGEFCGLDHHKMRFDVRIMAPDEFARWLEEARP